MIVHGVCHHGQLVYVEGCTECCFTAMGMKRDPALVDPDEFGRAMLGRTRPCPHGRLRALRDCELCDADERRTPAVTRIMEADGYQVRITFWPATERPGAQLSEQIQHDTAAIGGERDQKAEGGHGD